MTNTGVQRLISQNSNFLAIWGFLNAAHLIHVHEDYDQAVVNYFSCTKSSTAQKTRIFYRVSSGMETFIHNIHNSAVSGEVSILCFFLSVFFFFFNLQS